MSPTKLTCLKLNRKSSMKTKVNYVVGCIHCVPVSRGIPNLSQTQSDILGSTCRSSARQRALFFCERLFVKGLECIPCTQICGTPGSCRREAGGFCNVAVETKLKGQQAGTVFVSFWRKADSLHVTVEKINSFSSSDLDKTDPYVLIQYWTETKKLPSSIE